MDFFSDSKTENVAMFITCRLYIDVSPNPSVAIVNKAIVYVVMAIVLSGFPITLTDYTETKNDWKKVGTGVISILSNWSETGHWIPYSEWSPSFSHDTFL